MDTISVVITCYKEGDLLRRAFASLESQSDKDFDIVIVNDASPDETTNTVCRELGEKPRVQVIWRTANGGLSAARNSGYEAMTGDTYVALGGKPPGQRSARLKDLSIR